MDVTTQTGAMNWIDHNLRLAQQLMKSSAQAGDGHGNFAAHNAHHALKAAKDALEVNAELRAEIERLQARRSLNPTSPELLRDDCGMTPQHWRELCWEEERYHLSRRWKALKALWRSSGNPQNGNRCEEYSLWRAVQATIAIVLDRRWCDDGEARWKRRLGVIFISGTTLAAWDHTAIGYGWSEQVLDLYPGFRVEIYSDGD